MDSDNWMPNQSTEPTMDTSDWRAQLLPDSRHRVVNKIRDTMQNHRPVSVAEGLQNAQRIEERIFTAATSQQDYLRKISLKMLTMETRSQNTMDNNMPSNQVGPSNTPPDQVLLMQPQVHNTGQQLMGSHSNATNMQHAQMLGSQNNVGDIQQSQRVLSQQNAMKESKEGTCYTKPNEGDPQGNHSVSKDSGIYGAKKGNEETHD